MDSFLEADRFRIYERFRLDERFRLGDRFCLGGRSELSRIFGFRRLHHSRECMSAILSKFMN